MQKGKNRTIKKRDQLPETFNSISEAATFWDSHNSTDYEDVMEDAEFEIDIKRHIYLVPVAGNILDALREKAKAEGLSTETLVNILLQKQTLEGRHEAKS
jgi:predicted DNA binding CopG/RHH family protein